jgi:hypothetical protein
MDRQRPTSSYCFHAVFTILAAGSFAVLGANALAQWPTSYLAPRVISYGESRWAGDVLAMEDGGAVVAVDGTDSSGTRRMLLPRFDSRGNVSQTQNDFTNTSRTVVKADLLPGTAPYENGVALFAREVPDTIGQPFNPYKIYRTRETGDWINITTSGELRYEAATLLPGGFYQTAYYWPNYRAVGYTNGFGGPGRLEMGGLVYASDFVIAPTGNAASLVSFVKYGLEAETNTELWMYKADSTVMPGEAGPLTPGPWQPGVAQSDPQLLQMSDEEIALTWIGRSGAQKGLYVCTVSTTGSLLDDAHPVQPNVASYAITTSTLGIPIYAFVQHNTATVPPTDTLFAGLLDTSSGFSLNLPMASGLNIKIKDLRQEANGDFSLTYSVAEGGTNLLKVRRISGSSGSTLWETVVADLGIATDEFIERYENTFVSSRNSIMYVLSRKDQFFSTETSFQLARVRVDGQLGEDPLVAPDNLHALSSVPGDVTINWTDNNTAETHYIIGRTESDFSGLQILGAVGADVTAYDDPTAEANTIYYYYVAAYQADTSNFAISEPLTVNTGAIVF